MTRIIIALTLLLCSAAHAQGLRVPCLPSNDPLSTTASPLYSGISKNGAWVQWWCYSPQEIVPVIFVGTLAEFAKVGARVATISKAADPLRSLQTAGQRFTILPLSDPSLAAVLADMRAPK